MNTNGDQKAGDESTELVDAGRIVFPVDVIPKADQQISELQEQLQAKKDHYNELIFVFILFVVIVIDIFAFPHVNSNIGVSFISFLEIIALLILSKRLGAEKPYIFFVAMLKKLSGGSGKGED